MFIAALFFRRSIWLWFLRSKPLIMEIFGHAQHFRNAMGVTTSSLPSSLVELPISHSPALFKPSVHMAWRDTAEVPVTMERIWARPLSQVTTWLQSLIFKPLRNCADHTLRFSGFAMPPQCLTVICLAHPILKVHLSTPQRGAFCPMVKDAGGWGPNIACSSRPIGYIFPTKNRIWAALINGGLFTHDFLIEGIRGNRALGEAHGIRRQQSTRPDAGAIRMPCASKRPQRPSPRRI